MTRLCHGESKCFGWRPGFSLLEMLILITVTAIFAILLIAAATRVLDASKQAQCVNNLKQIGVGLHLYASDNDGLMPNQLPGGQGNPTWHSYLNQYLAWGSNGAGTRLGNCPAHPRKSQNRSFEYKRSYAMNSSYTPSFWRVGRVQHPEKAFLVGENQADSETRRITPGDVGFEHHQRANFLFLDGHVTTLSEDEIPPPSERGQPHHTQFWRPLEFRE